jgi:peroxiredoxin
MVKRHLVWMVPILLVTLSCGALAGAGESPAKVDEPAPRLMMPDLGGEQVDLSDYAGKVVLLNYWNLACKPCLEEFPTFQELHEEYGEKGLVIVAVHLGGPAQKVRDFVAEHGYTFIVAIDTEVTSTPPLPTTYIIDPEGIARHRWVGGPLQREAIMEVATPYLQEIGKD